MDGSGNGVSEAGNGSSSAVTAEREVEVVFEVSRRTLCKPGQEIGTVAVAARRLYLEFGPDVMLWFDGHSYTWDPNLNQGELVLAEEPLEPVVLDPAVYRPTLEGMESTAKYHRRSPDHRTEPDWTQL